MLSGMPAVARLFLCLLGLLAAATRPCSKDMVSRLHALNATVQMYPDCQLYTPSIQDYKNCPKATLRCFASEAKALARELAVLGLGTFSRLGSRLEALAGRFTQPESQCWDCELLQEEAAPKFVENLLSCLQMMNSLNCPRSRGRRHDACSPVRDPPGPQ